MHEEDGALEVAESDDEELPVMTSPDPRDAAVSAAYSAASPWTAFSAPGSTHHPLPPPFCSTEAASSCFNASAWRWGLTCSVSTDA
eukprot:2619449-Rhodomonas_salina.1